MIKDAKYWIKQLKLEPHPEGGYFRETYRSQEMIVEDALPERFAGPRSMSTAIYFLLRGDQVSRLHRIRSDELWHFYTGSALTIHIINTEGEYFQTRLGPEPDKGEVFQTVVSNRSWFGAAVDSPEGYSLVGCTVAPGFDFQDFEMGDPDELLAKYPEHAAIIEKLR